MPVRDLRHEPSIVDCQLSDRDHVELTGHGSSSVAAGENVWEGLTDWGGEDDCRCARVLDDPLVKARHSQRS